MAYHHLVVFANTKDAALRLRNAVKNVPKNWQATFQRKIERLPQDGYGPLDGFLVKHFFTEAMLDEKEGESYCRQWQAWSWTLNIEKELMDYRVVEFYPEDGKRYGKNAQQVLYKGPDVAKVHQALSKHAYDTGRRPYSETRIYQGRKRIYEYELPSIPEEE